MTRPLSLVLGTALLAAACTIPLGAASARSTAAAAKSLRTPYGAPDLSGNWTNVSMTPENRPGSVKGAVYTPEEVKKLESAAAKEETEANQNSDPNAGAPTVGGDKPKEGTRPEFVAAGGGVGGYDRGWLDPGNHVMRVRGEPRTSILTTPDGRIPKPKAGVQAPPGFGGGLGSFENPENRSLGERCIIGFGRNAGPPMLANGFYNNNYSFVQTKDEVDIVIEMVHDVRKIRIGGTHRTDGQRPYMGDSIGRWDGNTLVVETTNIPRGQAYYGSWRDLKVTERFTRLSPRPAGLFLHRGRPHPLGRALRRRVRVRPPEGTGLRIRLPRGQLRPPRHPGRRPRRRGQEGRPAKGQLTFCGPIHTHVMRP